MVYALLGVTLILIVLRDVFHTLFRPSGTGSLSDFLPSVVWRIVRALSTRWSSILPLAGPSALLLVIGAWTALLVFGWALIYWPFLPGDFAFSSSLNPARQGGFTDALYLSLVTLTTLGYGDIFPTTVWFRIVGPLEAVIGFVLLSASVSWILSIYPILSRRRSLAQELHLLIEATQETGISIANLDSDTLERLLYRLAMEFNSIRDDLIHFPITYYFHSPNERSALSRIMPHLFTIVLEEAERSERLDTVRLNAKILRRTATDFLDVVAADFLDLPETSSTEEKIASYANDHLRSW